ncbi:hypothetical protein Neosp_002767 [[Neocosmospora] mangrovei]
MAKLRLSAVLWAWIMVLAQFTSPVCGGSSPPSTERAPRAALVTLAHDYDLDAMLFTMQQLEEKFNSRYQYQWIFFSTEMLGDDFKELTSNATNATCIYEVIPNENWAIPGWTDPSQVPNSQENNMENGAEARKPIATIRQMNRWNSAPFAKERRLRDYDWFWRIEPGAQLTQDIPFDVFRFMRDNGIAYGFNPAIFQRTNLRDISPRIKSFVDKYPDLLHEDADMSCLLGNKSGPAMRPCDSDDDIDDLLEDEDESGLKMRIA